MSKDMNDRINLIINELRYTSNKSETELAEDRAFALSLYNGHFFREFKRSKDIIDKQIRTNAVVKRKTQRNKTRSIAKQKTLLDYSDVENGNLLDGSFQVFYRGIKCGKTIPFLEMLVDSQRDHRDLIRYIVMNNIAAMRAFPHLKDCHSYGDYGDDHKSHLICHLPNKKVENRWRTNKVLFLEVFYSKKTKLLPLESIKDKLKVVLIE